MIAYNYQLKQKNRQPGMDGDFNAKTYGNGANFKCNSLCNNLSLKSNFRNKRFFSPRMQQFLPGFMVKREDKNSLNLRQSYH